MVRSQLWLVEPKASLVNIRFVNTTDEIWDWTIGVNLKGAFWFARAVDAQMIKQGHGKLVFMASTNAWDADRGGTAKIRGGFPNEEAALKLLFLALRQAAKKWTMPIHHWMILRSERFSDSTLLVV
jgi:NAD(P)-dependent dehydrogenase (short-subunit alcohol dehydrogenase family)